jgi:DNA-binding winged helix-turn-helix (wHTH) protein
MRQQIRPSSEVAVTFGPYKFLPLQRVILCGGTPLRLGNRAREILAILVENAGEVVVKRELLRRVWPDTVVEEGTLRVHIAALRRALREKELGTSWVESVTGRGYRFVGPVVPAEEPPSAAFGAYRRRR